MRWLVIPLDDFARAGLADQSREKPPSRLGDVPGLQVQLLPLQLMFKPLRKRFKYHFHGKRQTNNIAKVGSSPWWLHLSTCKCVSSVSVCRVVFSVVL